MKNLLIMLICLLLGVAVGAQGFHVSGTVVDETGRPISGVEVVDYQMRTNYCHTDSSGNFYIFLPVSRGVQGLLLSANGFTREMYPITASGYYKIRLEAGSGFVRLRSANEPLRRRPLFAHTDPYRFLYALDFSVDHYGSRFDSFSDVLDSINSKYLARPLLHSFGIKSYYGPYSLRLFYGSSSSDLLSIDSVFRQYKHSQYGICLGVVIPLGSRFHLGLNTTFKNYRTRMRNSFTPDPVSLSTYMKNPDLDIRFNQPVIASELLFAFHSNNRKSVSMLDYLVGVYAGIQSQATRSTLVYSADTRLLNHRSMGLSQFTFGFRMEFVLKNEWY